MPSTLNEIASAIDNNVRNGVKGVTNYSYSMDQLEREVILEREKILDVLSRKPIFRTDGYSQEINKIPTDMKRLSKIDGDLPGKTFVHFRVPALVTCLEETAVEYVGPVSREGLGWRVYIGADHVLHNYRPTTKGRPYVYIDPVVDPEGWVDCWLINYRGNAKFIGMSAVFADPEQVKVFGPATLEDINFPVPGGMAEEIIKRLSYKYIEYHRKLRAPIQNNDQTDKAS